jgi:hypothetical protein
MPRRGDRQPRICRVCGETDASKFRARLATLCWKCRLARYEESVTRSRIKLRIRDKIAALSHYGPNGVAKCSWPGCEIDDVDMLVLDHVRNDGAAQRKAMGGTNGKGHTLYRILKKQGYPEGFQTLCCNHNHKKELLRVRKP